MSGATNYDDIPEPPSSASTSPSGLTASPFSGNPTPGSPSFPPSTPVSRAIASPGRMLGMAGYLLGLALAIAAYMWAFSVVHGTESTLPTGANATTKYLGWGQEQLFFILALLIFTLAGWAVAGVGARLYGGSSREHSDPLGMLLGAVGFCGGIGLVVLAFFTAAHYFGTAPGQAPAPGGDFLAGALAGLARILYLFVLVLNGSLFAGRGAGMFLASAGGSH